MKACCSNQSTCLSFRITNGGKSTLSLSLHQQIPNSCIIAQDSYFKVHSEAFFNSHWWLGSCLQVFSSISPWRSVLSPGGRCGAGRQQRIQAVWQWVRRNLKLILNTYAALWLNRKPQPVFSLLSKCLMLSTWTRWWATSILGAAILNRSCGSMVWTQSLQQNLTMRRCLCSSWKASLFSTTGKRKKNGSKRYLYTEVFFFSTESKIFYSTILKN